MSVDELCGATARLRQQWDTLRPHLDASLQRLHATLGDYSNAVWKADADREALKNARLALHRTRVLSTSGLTKRDFPDHRS